MKWKHYNSSHYHLISPCYFVTCSIFLYFISSLELFFLNLMLLLFKNFWFGTKWIKVLCSWRSVENIITRINIKMLKRISGFLLIAFMVHQSHGNLHKQCIFRDSFTCQVSDIFSIYLNDNWNYDFCTQ